MSSKTIIPEIEIKIGDNLYIQIKDISFIPAKKGVYDALPENCYPDEPAEADWQDKNCKLIIKKNICITSPTEILNGLKPQFKSLDFNFECDPSLAYEYYDQIIEAIEEMSNSDE